MLILLAVVIVVGLRLWYLEEAYNKTDRVITRMAKADLKAQKKRGDIVKGRCVYRG